MAKFPADAPIKKVIGTLEQLGFRLIREGNHIAMLRENVDGTRTPLTIPNHPEIDIANDSYSVPNRTRRFLKNILFLTY